MTITTNDTTKLLAYEISRKPPIFAETMCKLKEQAFSDFALINYLNKWMLSN